MDVNDPQAMPTLEGIRTPEEAERRMAFLMLRFREAHEEQAEWIDENWEMPELPGDQEIKWDDPEEAPDSIGVGHASVDDFIPDDLKVPKNIADKVSLAEERCESFGRQLYADPRFKVMIEPWMVMIEGKVESKLKEGDLDRLVKSPERFIASKSSVADNVQKILNSWGYEITERGAGRNGWDLGCPCGDWEADHLCALIQHHFRKAIDMGLITVSKIYWGAKIGTLRNSQAIEEWVEQYGDPTY